MDAKWRPCAYCGETLGSKRWDSLYCSGRCRVAAYRARLAAESWPGQRQEVPPGATERSEGGSA